MYGTCSFDRFASISALIHASIHKDTSNGRWSEMCQPVCDMVKLSINLQPLPLVIRRSICDFFPALKYVKLPSKTRS